MTSPKVFIAFPLGETARFNTFWMAFLHVQLPPAHVFRSWGGIYIATLQNMLAKEFLATDCDYFWLINDDQIYPPDILLRLFKDDCDIVGPLCLSKVAPHQPLAYLPVNDGGERFPQWYLPTGASGLIRKLGAIGGGGMLVRRKVFETIPYPWWASYPVTEEDGTIVQRSEDMDFCIKARAAGFDIAMDLDVSVEHKAHYGVRAERNEAGEWETALLKLPNERIIIPKAVWD